ncbi:CRISPR-associated endonuclease Cas2 [Anthocerotibacter panamensis]|uniref:CRISPR-associated endonuclease Cas2 n=1 Tax=Anthocerotibacter panamensis TaxID=2857077 RepID=UPI001C402967|nr:CRISPR-associated endonuclease Cas2 [Anthocerotibacter panamensis]
MLWIVTYDIPVTKRRTKVATLLSGYGKRVQFSVFECDLEQKQFHELKDRLQRLCQATEDSVRFYPIAGGMRSSIITWGGDPPLEQPSYYSV